MITSYAQKMTSTCLPMIGHLTDAALLNNKCYLSRCLDGGSLVTVCLGTGPRVQTRGPD